MVLRRHAAMAALAAAVALGVGQAHAADSITLSPLEKPAWGGPEAPVLGSTYAAFTGLAVGNQLALIEVNPPVRDDVVTFDQVPELINNYVSGAGGSLVRQVNETITVNSPTSQTMTITFTGADASGAPGDLFPTGFSSGGVPITAGGIGFGLNMPDQYDNSPTGDVLDFLPISDITGATITITTGGIAGNPLALPANFFSATHMAYPVPGSAWDGIIGIALNNVAGASGGVQNQVDIAVTYNIIPEPASLGALSLVGLGMLRRRRRA